MNFTIRLAKENDIQKYTEFLQQAYESTYTNNQIGIVKECFSKEVFNTLDTQKYIKSHLINSTDQKTWLVFSDKKLIGSMTCIIKNNQEAELTGFYVHKNYQNKGIGKKLYTLALEFAQNRDLILDTYLHNKKTIDIYTKWGWQIDTSRGDNGYFTRRWEEWPEGLNIKCIYLRLSHPSCQRGARGD